MLRDVVKDEGDHESRDAIVKSTNPEIMLRQKQEHEQEGDGQSYASRRCSSVDSLGPQIGYPPPPPPLPRGNKRDSMTSMASIARSKALRSGSLLKPSGRRKSDTNKSKLGNNDNKSEGSIQDQDEGMASP